MKGPFRAAPGTGNGHAPGPVRFIVSRPAPHEPAATGSACPGAVQGLPAGSGCGQTRLRLLMSSDVRSKVRSRRPLLTRPSAFPLEPEAFRHSEIELAAWGRECLSI